MSSQDETSAGANEEHPGAVERDDNNISLQFHPPGPVLVFESTTSDVCCVCMDRPQDTNWSGCTHAFCSVCVTTWRQSADEPKCPLCMSHWRTVNEEIY